MNFEGNSSTNFIFSWVNGCINSKEYACKYKPFAFKISPSIPYSLSPKIIESFDSENVIDFKNFPGQIDFNFTQVGDLTSIQSKIDDLNNRQAANEKLLQLLQKQLTAQVASESTNST